MIFGSYEATFLRTLRSSLGWRRKAKIQADKHKKHNLRHPRMYPLRNGKVFLFRCCLINLNHVSRGENFGMERRNYSWKWRRCGRLRLCGSSRCGGVARRMRSFFLGGPSVTEDRVRGTGVPTQGRRGAEVATTAAPGPRTSSTSGRRT